MTIYRLKVDVQLGAKEADLSAQMLLSDGNVLKAKTNY